MLTIRTLAAPSGVDDRPVGHQRAGLLDERRVAALRVDVGLVAARRLGVEAAEDLDPRVGWRPAPAPRTASGPRPSWRCSRRRRRSPAGTPGPGWRSRRLILISSQPSASVAASTPAVMYGHDSSSHSSQANFCGSGAPVERDRDADRLVRVAVLLDDGLRGRDARPPPRRRRCRRRLGPGLPRVPAASVAGASVPAASVPAPPSAGASVGRAVVTRCRRRRRRTRRRRGRPRGARRSAFG